MATPRDKVVEKFLSLVGPSGDDIREMYLFCSRCRNDWRPDSDYDVLVVLKRKDPALKDRLYDAVMEVLLSEGQLVSLKIFTASEFDRLKAIPTPFINKVLTEGRKLGRRD